MQKPLGLQHHILVSAVKKTLRVLQPWPIPGQGRPSAPGVLEKICLPAVWASLDSTLPLSRAGPGSPKSSSGKQKKLPQSP